jgi:hypothetical protein
MRKMMSIMHEWEGRGGERPIYAREMATMICERRG